MLFVVTKDGAGIFCRDWGSGHPILFHHGWPLSADDWETQMQSVLKDIPDRQPIAAGSGNQERP